MKYYCHTKLYKSYIEYYEKGKWYDAIVFTIKHPRILIIDAEALAVRHEEETAKVDLYKIDGHFQPKEIIKQHFWTLEEFRNNQIEQITHK